MFRVPKGTFVTPEKNFCSRNWTLYSTSNTSLWNFGSKICNTRSTSNRGFTVFQGLNWDILRTLLYHKANQSCPRILGLISSVFLHFIAQGKLFSLRLAMCCKNKMFQHIRCNPIGTSFILVILTKIDIEKCFDFKSYLLFDRFFAGFSLNSVLHIFIEGDFLWITISLLNSVNSVILSVEGPRLIVFVFILDF